METVDRGTQSKPWYQKPGPVGAFIALVLAVIVVIGIIVTHNNVVNEGNQKQQELNRYYKETENVLSDCEVKTKSAIGVTQGQTKALDAVISEAVRGRYTAPSNAVPGTNGALFSAIREAYPDTSGLSKSFENVQIIINGCRTNFKDSQSELQGAVERFNKWRTGSWTVRTFGGGNYPNDELVVKTENGRLTGDEALEQMGELVVLTETRKERETGNLEVETPFQEEGSGN